MFDLIWLSIIQGVTEFLPISSSAHLVLYSHFFNFNYDNLSLDISGQAIENVPVEYEDGHDGLGVLKGLGQGCVVF